MSQRILVVDDEPAIADAVADRLRSDGYDVAVVHDGLAAVAYCRATPPDLMVLDLMLPGLDGVGQMLRQTERLGRMVPQLLDLSRLESGADPFERTSVQVSALFGDIERELHLAAPDQKLMITVEQRDLVFDRFRRVDPSRGGSGSGLGLAIARRIVDLHDGDIRIAETGDGTGCRVVIDLPTHQEPA